MTYTLRLRSGQAWDNTPSASLQGHDGNLLSDGVSTYSYNHARGAPPQRSGGDNRLASVVQGPTTYAFAYNGLGDRLRQTVNGLPTNYTVDLAAGLTQVLADGSNTYLFGVGRIGEEQPGGWAYHLPDALGSVRQLANASAAVTLERSYEPFGDMLASAGSATTAFQFTGEARDGTGLTYLRARYYASRHGRFITHDPFAGSLRWPSTWNGWAYARGNPVNSIDPTGYFAIDFPSDLPAALLVVSAKVVYSKVSPFRNCLLHPYDGQYPTDTVDDLLTDFICEYGEWDRVFEQDAHLTQQLSRTIQIGMLRTAFYLEGADVKEGETSFGLGNEFILATIDTILEGDELRLDIGLTTPISITHFLGSFDYRISRSGGGYVSFEVVNDTELRSGSRIPPVLGGIDPRNVAYATTVEELIMQNPLLALEPIGELLQDYPIIGILRVKTRAETGFLEGGGFTRQTFLWSDPDFTCVGVGLAPVASALLRGVAQ